MLNKRAAFRKAFDDFDIDKVRQYDDEKKSKLMQNAGIIRNRLKINAAVNNASVFKAIQEEFGSFADYIWGFTGGKVIYECDRISSPLSDRISEDLKKRGMKFVGTVIILKP